MSQNIQIEAQLLALSILTGAALMMAYDVLRILRMLIPHSWAAIGAEDLLYWCAAGLAVFYLLYRENDGSLRMYVIGTVLFAMVAYDRCFSRFFLKVLKKAGRWIRIKILKRNRR